MFYSGAFDVPFRKVVWFLCCRAFYEASLSLAWQSLAPIVDYHHRTIRLGYHWAAHLHSMTKQRKYHQAAPWFGRLDVRIWGQYICFAVTGNAVHIKFYTDDEELHVTGVACWIVMRELTGSALIMIVNNVSKSEEGFHIQNDERTLDTTAGFLTVIYPPLLRRTSDTRLRASWCKKSKWPIVHTSKQRFGIIHFMMNVLTAWTTKMADITHAQWAQPRLVFSKNHGRMNAIKSRSWKWIISSLLLVLPWFSFKLMVYWRHRVTQSRLLWVMC